MGEGLGLRSKKALSAVCMHLNDCDAQVSEHAAEALVEFIFADRAANLTTVQEALSAHCEDCEASCLPIPLQVMLAAGAHLTGPDAEDGLFFPVSLQLHPERELGLKSRCDISAEALKAALYGM